MFDDRVTLDGESELALVAAASADGCVKARLTGLDPLTDYFYRFVYRTADGAFVSRTGHTRTAPLPDADVAARFAFVSCQDFNGKYYNVHRRLGREDLDFFVHLGDYIYETTGDPSFQDTSPGRVVAFTDSAGAITIEEDGESFQSARSLDNYRELYRTYRGDPNLQALHEKFAMVAVWDDHEFSDDSYGANATITTGREDEYDPERRQNATQAWFDYMPVDYLEPDFAYSRDVAPPNDIRIYRDIRWGANLHIALTDLRLFRPDHVVPEDAFPGRVAIEEAALEAQLGALPEWAEPYVDVTTYAEGVYATLLRDVAAAVGFDESHATGLVATRYINGFVQARIDDGDDSLALIDDAELPRGLAFITLGKSSPFSSIGSRYLAIAEPYEAYAGARFAESNGASEDILGADQEAWLLDTLQNTNAVWKVWGSEYTLSQRHVDTRTFAVPPDFQQIFKLSAEDWDGCPNKRDALIDAFSDVDNVVAIAGDIHAFFAGTPWVRGDRSKRIVEFVGGALSSGSYQTLLLRTAQADPGLRDANAPLLALLVEDLLIGDDPATNAALGYANMSHNGFSIAEVNAANFDVTYYTTPEANIREEMSDAALDEAFEVHRFRVNEGEKELYREIDGQFRRWDPDTFGWV